jgi:hypothetical protein
MRPNLEVGSVWKRRVPLKDELDEIQIVGQVYMGEGEPVEYTITTLEFGGPIIQTSREGIADFCELVRPGPAQSAAWEL